jgi:hypothetical protein
MRKALSAISGILGGSSGLMMQVGPHDAATNFCNWLSFWKACPGSLPAWFDEWAWAFPVSLLLLTFALLSWPLLRVAIKGRPAALSNPLQIRFGTGGSYETKRSHGLYQTKHTFSVAVKNADPKQFLSNCKFYLDIADPKTGTEKTHLLVDTFTLNASEERFVEIVSYDEPATISQHAGTDIRLHVPVHAGYWGAGAGWPWQLAVGAYTFTLRATSKEMAPRAVVCKTWVDEAGKLHFEKA